MGIGNTLLPGAMLQKGTAVGTMFLVKHPLESGEIYAGIQCKKMQDCERAPLELVKHLKKEVD